jgi:hypothetical protein
MAKFNADEKIYEPIEVVLGGKTYTVQDVKQEMFDRIKAVATEVTDGTEAVLQQLAVLLGEDVEVLRQQDLRRAGAVLKFLIDNIGAQIEGKAGNA